MAGKMMKGTTTIAWGISASPPCSPCSASENTTSSSVIRVPPDNATNSAAIRRCHGMKTGSVLNRCGPWA